MTEKAPVADFSQVLGEFNQITASREIAARGEYAYAIKARHKWKELLALREAMLDTLLVERGLAVCSQAVSHFAADKYLKVHVGRGSNHAINKEEVAKLDQQDLGIFPKDQLRLYFTRLTQLSYNGNPYLEGYYQVDELQLLCPEHFPDESDRAIHSNARDTRRQSQLDIKSGVMEKDGKLITKVGDVDVTKIPIERVMDDAIYEYFGLPELPPKPEF